MNEKHVSISNEEGLMALANPSSATLEDRREAHSPGRAQNEEIKAKEKLYRLEAELESLKQDRVNTETPTTPRRQIYTGIRAVDHTMYTLRAMTFRDVLDMLIDARYLIVVITLLVVLGGFVGMWLTETKYRADGSVQIEKTARSISTLPSTSNFLADELLIAQQIEIAGSRRVLGQVVDNLKLDIVADPWYFPWIGHAIARGNTVAKLGTYPWPKALLTPLLDVLDVNKYAWGGEYIKVTSFDVPNDYLSNPFTLIAGENGHYQLTDELGQKITDGIVGMPIEAPLPGGGLLKLVVSEIQAMPGVHFNLMKQHRQEAIRLLGRGLQIREKGIDGKARLLEFRMSGSNPEYPQAVVNEAMAVYLRENARRQSAEVQQSIDLMEGQLPVLNAKLEKAEEAFNNYRLQHGTVDLGRETQLLLERIISVETNLSQLKRNREELLQSLNPPRTQLETLDGHIATLSKELNSLNGRVRNLPSVQQQILRLSRDVEVYNGLYTSLLNKVQDLKLLTQEGGIRNASILDYAEAAANPAKRKPATDFSLAVIIGVILGISLVFLRKALRIAIDDPVVIEKCLELPVYAIVPHSPKQRKILKGARRKAKTPTVLAAADTEDLAVESLRSLRTLLHFAMIGAKNNVIMLTSSVPGAGKSFITANLGTVVASSGKRVLIIDADLRKGLIHDYFGLEREGGLSDFIAGDLSVEQLIRKPIEGLDVITTGTIPPNPSELLLQGRFSSLVKALATRYDHVIIDTSPILVVTDAAIIGRLVGAALLVVKAGMHSLPEIEEAIKRLKQADINLCGAVFNDIDTSRRSYGYGKYGYAYAYKK